MTQANSEVTFRIQRKLNLLPISFYILFLLNLDENSYGYWVFGWRTVNPIYKLLSILRLGTLKDWIFVRHQYFSNSHANMI